MALAYKPTSAAQNNFVESAKKVKIPYSVAVSRSATTLGTASVTITQDFIATYANFSGYIESFDANPHTRDYTLVLNNVSLARCVVVHTAPTTSYQGHTNETAYFDAIKVYKNSTLSIVCGGSVGNVNSGTFILGGYLE